ncbi:MAG: transcription termination/antitermination protein NusA [Deltaproteobacteria bacterium]|nr:transcription termination/antitermination protein NusA [Deltaproteobacteria bacterium]
MGLIQRKEKDLTAGLALDLKRVIDQVSRDRGIDKQILIGTLVDAIRQAAKKKLGLKREIEVNYNEDLGEIEVFEFKEVVEKVKDPEAQITIEEGRKLDPECEVGDSLGIKMETSSFGRIAAQSAKQVIIQRMKDAERDIVFEDYKDRKGEVINGIIQRFDKGAAIINLGRTEAVLPVTEQIPTETYKQGDRLRAYILEVKKISKGPQIILSRTHPMFLAALFETEVPEIAEKIVRIVHVVREPGSRSKIAVMSEDRAVDPVGACVGMKGNRVQNVVQELRGEKIDIIPWNPDPAKFICNALAPAEIIRVIIDEVNRSMEVVVPDEQLSLAIGKRGQNVRLASRLTGWKIDVKSESKYDKSMRDGYQSLLQITGVGEATADALYKQGFQSAQEVIEASLEELLQIPGLSQKKAEKLLESASAFLNLEKQKDVLDKQREEETRLQQQEAAGEVEPVESAGGDAPASTEPEDQE